MANKKYAAELLCTRIQEHLEEFFDLSNSNYTITIQGSNDVDMLELKYPFCNNYIHVDQNLLRGLSFEHDPKKEVPVERSIMPFLSFDMLKEELLKMEDCIVEELLGGFRVTPKLPRFENGKVEVIEARNRLDEKLQEEITSRELSKENSMSKKVHNCPGCGLVAYQSMWLFDPQVTFPCGSKTKFNGGAKFIQSEKCKELTSNMIEDQKWRYHIPYTPAPITAKDIADTWGLLPIPFENYELNIQYPKIISSEDGIVTMKTGPGDRDFYVGIDPAIIGSKIGQGTDYHLARLAYEKEMNKYFPTVDFPGMGLPFKLNLSKEDMGTDEKLTELAEEIYSDFEKALTAGIKGLSLYLQNQKALLLESVNEGNIPALSGSELIKKWLQTYQMKGFSLNDFEKELTSFYIDRERNSADSEKKVTVLMDEYLVVENFMRNNKFFNKEQFRNVMNTLADRELHRLQLDLIKLEDDLFNGRKIDGSACSPMKIVENKDGSMLVLFPQLVQENPGIAKVEFVFHTHIFYSYSQIFPEHFLGVIIKPNHDNQTLSLQPNPCFENFEIIFESEMNPETNQTYVIPKTEKKNGKV